MWGILAFFGAFILWILKLVLCIIGAALLLLWLYQGMLLYMPTAHSPSQKRQICFNQFTMQSPGNYWGVPYDDIYVTTQDRVNIHCWLIKQPNAAQCPTIVYVHGNAGNIGFRLENSKQMYQTLGCNIMLVEYRGYGNSEGTPSERGLEFDMEAGLDYLRERPDIDSSKIILFGRSLGGAVAIAVAKKRQDDILCLIVENTFTSILDMVLTLADRLGIGMIRMLSKCLYHYISNLWPSDEKMPKIKVPILFLSGLADQLIPPAHMQSLYDLSTASSYRKIEKFPNGDHNGTWWAQNMNLPYYEKILNFLTICQSNQVGMR